MFFLSKSIKRCKIKITKILFLSILFAFAFSFTGTALSVPALTGRVVDNAGILTYQEQQKTVEVIKKFEDETKGQIAVLIIRSLDGESLEDYSMEVAESWKIGYRGKDNGILIVIVKDDRKIRIEVGYGWEQYVTDARVGDVIRLMAPYFRKGEFAFGVQKAVEKLGNYIKGSPADDDFAFRRSSLPYYLGFIAIIIALIYLFVNEYRCELKDKNKITEKLKRPYGKPRGKHGKRYKTTKEKNKSEFNYHSKRFKKIYGFLMLLYLALLFFGKDDGCLLLIGFLMLFIFHLFLKIFFKITGVTTIAGVSTTSFTSTFSGGGGSFGGGGASGGW